VANLLAAWFCSLDWTARTRLPHEIRRSATQPIELYLLLQTKR
jgi:hypothetical protein